jgi:hypothetical protein
MACLKYIETRRMLAEKVKLPLPDAKQKLNPRPISILVTIY